VLLLDEPFGALDAQVRAELRGWLRRLHDEIHITTVFVTHDQDEAFEVADRVVVMNRGKIEQAGTPAEVFEHPANDFVMRFLGHVNVIDAVIHDGYARIGDVTFAVGSHNGEARAPQAAQTTGALGDEPLGRVYVRPHDVDVARTRTTGAFAAQVLRVTPLSGGIKVELSVPSFGTSLRADLDWERGSALGLRGGDDVYLSLRRARVFPHDGSAPSSGLTVPAGLRDRDDRDHQGALS
jgi:sulfate transport system ATP-binding protein